MWNTIALEQITQGVSPFVSRHLVNQGTDRGKLEEAVRSRPLNNPRGADPVVADKAHT
jgi:hypothetical protein